MFAYTHAAPHSRPASCVKTNVLVTPCSYREAEASTSERADWQPMLCQQPAGLVSPSPGEENILSWAHPLSIRTIRPIVPHVQKPGSILCHLRALPPSCLAWEHCFFCLLACSLDDLSTGLEAWPASSGSAWQTSLLGAKTRSANEHFLNGISQNAWENKIHKHARTSKMGISWCSPLQKSKLNRRYSMELKHCYKDTEGGLQKSSLLVPTFLYFSFLHLEKRWPWTNSGPEGTISCFILRFVTHRVTFHSSKPPLCNSERVTRHSNISPAGQTDPLLLGSVVC